MYNETTRLVKVVMPAAGGSGAIMLCDTAENLFIAYEVVAMVKDEETGKTHFSQLRWKKLGELETDGGGEKSVADPSGDGEQIGVKGAMRSDDDTSDDEPQLVYQFMFESGDLFVAAAADEYPALDGEELQMLSDDSSSGGGGDSILPPLSDANLGDVPMCLEGDGEKTVNWVPGMPFAANANAGDVLTVVTNTNASTGDVTKEAAWVAPSASGGGVLVVDVTVDYNTGDVALDKTWQEIYDADFAVLKHFEHNSVEPAYVTNIGTPIEGVYEVVFCSCDGVEISPAVFGTDSPDGYPVLQGSGGSDSPLDPSN